MGMGDFDDAFGDWKKEQTYEIIPVYSKPFHSIVHNGTRYVLARDLGKQLKCGIMSTVKKFQDRHVLYYERSSWLTIEACYKYLDLFKFETGDTGE